jgi:hypothetical protein
LVSDSLNAKLNSKIANVTSEMRKENDCMRQEFSIQLQTEVQSVAKEVEVVRKSTNTELTSCVQNFESMCNGINESMNTYKSLTDASVNSLRLETSQNREEIRNKVGELALEIRSVASGLDECNSTVQADRQTYQSEIQKLKSEIEILRVKINNNPDNQAASAVCASPQTSSEIRVVDTGQPTGQVSSAISESASHISPGVNSVNVCNVSACDSVNATAASAVSCIKDVSAQSEKSVDTSQYNELSLPKFSDSSKQVVVHFIRELDEYFTLKKTPEELRLPLVFRSISDPFAKQWMLTTYGQLKSYNDFKTAFKELLWDGTRQSEIRCRVYQDRYDYRSGESFSEHYIRYANMASMLSPAMSDQDLLGAMVTHYEPRIQACLISANLKSTQEALAVLSKLQSLETSREQYRPTRRDFESRDQNRRVSRDQQLDRAGNPGPSGSVQVRHVRQDGRDRNPTGDSMRNPRSNRGRRNFYGGQGRPNNGIDHAATSVVRAADPHTGETKGKVRP